MRTMIAVAVSGLLLISALTGGVDARPQYKKAFGVKYPAVVKKQGKEKSSCNICHPEKSKKKRNNYGTALSKVVKKNEKDTKKIAEALGKIEKEKSATKDKTFGDLLSEGGLPGDK